MARAIAAAMAVAMAVAMAYAIDEFGNESALLFSRSPGYPSVDRRVTRCFSGIHMTSGKPIPRVKPMAEAMRLPMDVRTGRRGSQAKPLPSTYGWGGLLVGYGSQIQTVRPVTRETPTIGLGR